MTRHPRNVPASTYRLQLTPAFTFRDARNVLGYLADLGVTHLYLSPITEAVAGSIHGYDVTDPTRIRAELGGEEEFRVLAAAARERGLGIVLDIVPNHTATAEANWRWMDVLRHGRDSAYARWFDIDWSADDEVAQRGKVLLPILGDAVEAVLERGELRIEVQAAHVYLRYFDRRLPLAPGSVTTPSAFRSPADLRALLAQQHYALDYWRSAKAHVDYRRFFTIDELVGMRVEDATVFAGTHHLYARLQRERLIDGVRVDHADGLSDPAAYFARLRRLLGDEAYIVAEKILAPHESLPDWPIDGTSGYDFMNDATGMLTDGAGLAALDLAYTAATGRQASYSQLRHEARLRILDGPLGAQFARATGQLYRALAPRVEYEAFAGALRALMACIPVYRTYHSADRVDEGATEVIRAALEEARAAHPEVDADALDGVAAILAAPPQPARVAVMRLQQLMPAVEAKASEDNAFYRYVPLLSRNEVGSDPSAPLTTPGEFHSRNTDRARRWPAAMLATATHDHKRGEDARARLVTIAEDPGGWAAFHEALLAAAGPSPSSLDAYIAAQTVAAIWPAGPHDGAPAEVPERLSAYLVKAAREGGERTTWDDPDEAYEAELAAFAAAVAVAMAGRLPETQRRWLESGAGAGRSNSLAQSLLRLTSPGVPDTYRGTELWDFSLVDPDNRRPVNYEARAAMLEELRPLLEDGPAACRARREAVAGLGADPSDPRLKLYVVARALRRRQRTHPLYTRGEYVPLETRGPRSDHVLAFARREGRRLAVAAVTRLPLRLATHAEEPGGPWGETSIVLPVDIARELEDAFTGWRHAPSAASEGGILSAGAIFRTLPVALLEPVDS